jgi:riboflavin synthase alpha subunit
MFTGIVQEMGKIVARSAAGDAMRFTIAAPALAPKLSVGDSVACDGVCLTVETLFKDPEGRPPPQGAEGEPVGFTACAVPETLAKTTLSLWAVEGLVNLEPALTASSPLGGHFVLGHVDGVCEVTAIKNLGDGGREMTVRLPAEFLPFCVYKGSITLAGVSLTIAAVEDDLVRVALIPHTLGATTLGLAVPRGRLNFEADILAKHVERQLQAREARLQGSGHAVP